MYLQQLQYATLQKFVTVLTSVTFTFVYFRHEHICARDLSLQMSRRAIRNFFCYITGIWFEIRNLESSLQKYVNCTARLSTDKNRYSNKRCDSGITSTLYVFAFNNNNNNNNNNNICGNTCSVGNRKIIMSDFVRHYDFPVTDAFPNVVRTLANR
jgi:hypothetical protein